MSDDERKARFEQALRRAGPTHTVADIVKLIQERRAQLWERDDGVIVTEILEYPLVKTINYWLAAGSLPACLALQADIDEFARAEGCEIATISGRRGWGRAAAADGWRLRDYQFWKPLASKQFWSTQR